jgi:hypothetical protein
MFLLTAPQPTCLFLSHTGHRPQRSPLRGGDQGGSLPRRSAPREHAAAPQDAQATRSQEAALRGAHHARTRLHTSWTPPLASDHIQFATPTSPHFVLEVDNPLPPSQVRTLDELMPCVRLAATAWNHPPHLFSLPTPQLPLPRCPSLSPALHPLFSGPHPGRADAVRPLGCYSLEPPTPLILTTHSSAPPPPLPVSQPRSPPPFLRSAPWTS